MKTTNFEAETWFQRPETPSRVLEPLGTKINFAACHRSDAMVAKKVEYRSDLKYGVTVVSHQMASADSPGSPLGFQTPPPLPRWPLEAMMASRHLQSPESGSQQRSRAGFRTRQYPNGLWSRARPPRPPRTQGGVWRPSGVVQGFKTPQRTPAW
jgi:hypothetical protein